MGNSNSNNSGLNEYCYQKGYDHATDKNILHPDPIGQGIDAFPCTTNRSAARSYGEGYSDGYRDSNPHLNTTNDTTNNVNSNGYYDSNPHPSSYYVDRD